MEAVEITCCRKFYIYFFLAFNIFISLVILLLLFLSTYDVVFLDWYQYMYRYNLPYILEVVGMSRHGYRLQEKNNNSLKDVNSYIMHTFNRELTGVDKLRIKIIMKYIRLLIKHKRSSNFEMHLLYLLLNME